MPFNLDDYEPVEARIARFYEENPDGSIITNMEKAADGEFIVRASVWRRRDDADVKWATGYAREIITDRGVNSTSALENCETSAIGRALANAGYAAKGKRPSREEMARVEKVTPQQASVLLGMLDQLGAYPPAWKAAHLPTRSNIGELANERFEEAEAILHDAIKAEEPF